MCKTAYLVFDIMNNHNFMTLYIYQIFSPYHAGRANLGCNTSLDSNLVNKDVRSRGVNRAVASFCELMIEI